MNRKKGFYWILLVIAVLAAASLTHLYPLLPHLTSSLPFPKFGDVNLTIAILYSNLDYLSGGQWRDIYHLPFLYPYSHALSMGFTMLGHAVLLWPFHELGLRNVYLTYNLLVFLAYILAGLGAYFLFLELAGGRLAALAAAVLYLLVPFRAMNTPHLNLLFSFPIPFCFLALYRFLRGGGWKNLLLINLWLLAQFLFDLSLGFYLAIALLFFALLCILLERGFRLRRIGLLALSLAPTLLLLLAIYHPFFDPVRSLSSWEGGFNFAQYSPSYSFYTGKSYLLNLVHQMWDFRPFHLGYAASFFFLFAFWGFLESRCERIVFWTVAAALVAPALLLLCPFGRSQALELATEIGITLFAIGLILLTWMLHKNRSRRLPAGMALFALSYLAVVVVSFEPFPRLFDLFSLISRVLPFISRSRGVIRTNYIFSLLELAVVAIGLQRFLSKPGRPRLGVALLFLLMLGEVLRWPVQAGRLVEPGVQGLAYYREIDRLPIQSGLMELPFGAEGLNIYPQFTRFHDKHTIHGFHYHYSDALELEKRPELDEAKGFPGLADPAFAQFLCSHRLRLILIFRSFLSDTSRWMEVKQHVTRGQELGLYERVERSGNAILLLLRDRLEGRSITIHLPNYFFLGKKKIRFWLDVPFAGGVQARFNGRGVPLLRGAGAGEWEIDLGGLAIAYQVNTLVVEPARGSLRLENLRLE